MIAYVETLERVSPQNLSSLRQLVRSITLAQGQFCLILACCNQSQLQRQMIKQLRRLPELHLEELMLESSTETLYSTIARHFHSYSPDGVMVYGFESVRHLSQLLIATNHVREEFRNFKFPVVLWVNDDVMKQFVRLIPDFFSWASTGIEFVDEYKSFESQQLLVSHHS
ncbi:hypothetical protein [Limnoraphis robusta]|uniref:WD-repeat protein n=1 Tax=Limnoraphis robusta CCNP1315 TaxID=3110306 RepID=A0ABU5U4J5_9CYAN|nr:hypothetical protein [Limnoraphis robusta]MEA5522114.1 hypothetical protein [Limnoraphis robusta CCNP1315]MEA5544182.1 hypothetical protein [Limnoraphis robusta CCNP1324]